MKVWVIVVAILGFSSFCHAEPSSQIQYLMTEPVTLFDLGILRLHEYVEGYASNYLQTKPVEDIYSTVTYDAPKQDPHNLRGDSETGSAKGGSRLRTGECQEHLWNDHPRHET